MSDSMRNYIIVGLVAVVAGIFIGRMVSTPRQPTYQSVSTYDTVTGEKTGGTGALLRDVEEEPEQDGAVKRLLRAQEQSQASDDGSDTVHITRTGSKYHRGGCRHLARSDIPISRKEAKAKGYEPCGTCGP